MANSRRCLVLKILVLLILQGVSGTVAAQPQRKIDSLRSLLPGQTDEQRADIFYEMAYQYVDFVDTLGVQYGEKSFQLAKKIGDSLRMVKAGRIKDTAFRRLEEMDSAITLGLQLLSIAKRNHYNTEVKQILRGIGVAYILKGKYDFGLGYNFELLKVTEQDKDSVEMRLALSNIGLIYYKLANYRKALQYYHRALDVKSPLEKYPHTTALLNISLCYSMLKDSVRAREFLKKGIDSFQPPWHNTLMFEVLRACGVFHFYKGDLDIAEIYYLRSYSLAKVSGHQRNQLIVVFDLAETYFQRNKIPQVIKYLSEAESVMQDSPFGHELVWLYSSFFSFYKKTGDVKRMAFYQNKYIQLTDSIYGQRLTNNLMKIESDYLERKNKARIIEQEGLLTLKDEMIKWQTALNILIAIIAALLGSLLYVLYRSNRQRRSVNRLLELKVKERTAELEASYLILKQSFEEEDVAITETFMQIKGSAGVIKGLCTSGLETEHAEPKKCLEEISRLTGRVSAVLNRIRCDRILHT
jgi:tetratricopeptide (TPR) repeat protein